MIYSHLNPIFYIMVLKEFQDQILCWIIGFKNVLFYNKIDEVDGKTEEIGSIKHEAKITQVVDNQNKKVEVNTIERVSTHTKRALLSAIISLMTSLVFAAVFSASCKLQLSDRNHSLKTGSTQLQKLSGQKKLGSSLREEVLGGYAHQDNIRSLCAANRGIFDFDSRLCLFVDKHEHPGLNLVEQVMHCEIKNATLAYPRSEAEVVLLWDFFEQANSHLSIHDFRDLSIHVGLFRGQQMPLYGDYMYRSVDDKMDFHQSGVRGWFYKKDHYVGFSRVLEGFHSPALCITKAKILSDCMPRTAKQYSICFHDF